MQQEPLVLPSGVVVRGSTGSRYVIEGLLGKGEMGAVYLVRDRHVEGKVFALKEVINPDKHDRERFIFEGGVLKRLNHRALPRVYRLFENAKLKRVYILMDYIKGNNLEVLRQQQPQGRFPLALVVLLMSPIVDALMYLHTQNPPIIHRDVKPANVIVPVGADEAILVDFGSAKEYIPTGTATIASRRTPGYAAPEQYGSGTNPGTDIYGLSATLYTLLTGTVPVNAVSRLSKVWNNGSDPLKPVHVLNPDIPEAVSQALQRGMAVSSADRFETVEELWQIMTAYAEPPSQKEQFLRLPITEVPVRDIESIAPAAPEAPADAPHFVQRELFILMLIALIIIAVLLLGFVFHIVTIR